MKCKIDLIQLTENTQSFKGIVGFFSIDSTNKVRNQKIHLEQAKSKSIKYIGSIDDI